MPLKLAFMSSTAKPPTDPIRFIESLDADQIAERLAQLSAEERALRVLLRSARARQAAKGRQRKREEAADASR
jgi:hypothetical protein